MKFGRHALLSRGWGKKDKLRFRAWLTTPWRFESFSYSN